MSTYGNIMTAKDLINRENKLRKIFLSVLDDSFPLGDIIDWFYHLGYNTDLLDIEHNTNIDDEKLYICINIEKQKIFYTINTYGDIVMEPKELLKYIKFIEENG